MEVEHVVHSGGPDVGVKEKERCQERPYGSGPGEDRHF